MLNGMVTEHLMIKEMNEKNPAHIRNAYLLPYHDVSMNIVEKIFLYRRSFVTKLDYYYCYHYY